MRLDTYQHDLGGPVWREMLRYGGDPHAEGGFVYMLNGIRYRKLGACFPQPGAVLRGGVDGDAQYLGGPYELLRGKDSARWCEHKPPQLTRRRVNRYIFSYSCMGPRNFS